MRSSLPAHPLCFAFGVLAVLAVPWAARGQPADAPTAPPTAVPEPFTAVIDDPMLAPVPAPPVRLGSWKEARELLQARSTDLRSAEAGVQRAEGRWRQSLAALLPNARLTAGVGYDVLSPESPSFPAAGGATAALLGQTEVRPTAPLGAAAVSLSQSVVDVSAWRGLSSAAAGQRSSEATLEDTRRRVTQGLARVLIAVVSAERAAELNRVGLRQALERAALTQRTFELGAATQLDVVRVRQDVAVARSALVAGDEQVRRTREALGAALGTDAEVGVVPGFSLEGLVQETRQQCQALPDWTQRSDLVAAQAQVEAAAESRRQASAGYLPSLGVTSSVIGVTTTPGPARVPTWNISLVLGVPLWEGGLRSGLVAERTGAEEQAQQSAENLRRSVLAEIARSRRATEVAQTLVTAAAEAQTLAARADELTRKSFQIGRASSLEIVQSAVVLRQAELNLALREFELVQARLDTFLTEARCDG